MKRDSSRYGDYGGMFIPEILIPAVKELQRAYEGFVQEAAFQQELADLLKNYVGRPTPLTEAKRLSNHIQGPRIFLKREDLLHTGAHKINNAIGQCLLAKKLGKTRIIAETGAGQHGVATASACAYMGLDCVVYMGAVDMARQEPNVKRMRLLGAKVVSVETGSKTLKDAVNEALRDWSATAENTHYCLGSALGPYPFPQLAALFHRVIGDEARVQILEQVGVLPKAAIACVGGGSNAIGLFQAFLDDDVKLIGVEAGGHGKGLGEHAARFSGGRPGILHGAYTYVLQNDEGQVVETASISAGLDYPAVGPQHAYLHDIGRAEYVSANDKDALNALELLSKTEGIIPALESSHALAHLINTTKDYARSDCVIINISGRGDKDLPQIFDNHLLEI